MKNLLNFKTLRAKMLLAFSFIMILVIIFSAFTLFSLIKINKDTEEMINKQLPLLIADEEIAYDRDSDIITSIVQVDYYCRIN